MEETSANNDTNHEEAADWFLQHLVSIVNNLGSGEFGITLTVSGTLISGYLTGGHNYFEGFAEEFAASFEVDGVDDGVAASVRESIGRLGQMYNRPDTAEEEADEQETHRTTYIHIRDAKMFHPGGAPIPSNRGVWWRGKLDAVDGRRCHQHAVVRYVKYLVSIAESVRRTVACLSSQVLVRILAMEGCYYSKGSAQLTYHLPVQ